MNQRDLKSQPLFRSTGLYPRKYPTNVSSEGNSPLIPKCDDSRACTRNNRLLRRNGTDGLFQDVRHLRRRGHLLWRFDLRRHSDDERSLSGCHSGSLRRAVWRWRSRMGRGLDRVSHRAVDVGAAMHTTKRGEPSAINQALNRPRAKLGLDLSAWMAIVFVCVTVFLVGFPNAGNP